MDPAAAMKTKPVLFECHAPKIDVRVAPGIPVLVMEADEGRVIVSTSKENLEALQVRIRLALDSAEQTGARPTDK